MPNRIERVLAELSTPCVLLSYNTDEGFPKRANVTSYQCEDCTASIVSNRLNEPFCPCCRADLKQANNKVVAFTDKNYKDLQPLAVCAECNTSFVTNDETLKALAGEKIFCTTCCTPIIAEDSDETTDNEDTTTKTDTSSSDDSEEDVDNNDSDESNDSDDNAETDDTDPELDAMVKNLAPADADSSTANTDDATSKDTTSKDTPPKDTTKKPDETSSTEDENTSSSDEDDNAAVDTKSMDVTASHLQIALANSKFFDLVHSSDYSRWYLYADDAPLAIAAQDRASADVKKVFKSDMFKNAFETAVATDNGLNTELLHDFGFDPVEVKVDINDIQQQMLDDELNKKTAELTDRIESTANLYTSCFGIAAVADMKGITPVPNSIRGPLIARLEDINFRNPDKFVDKLLADLLPGYIEDLNNQAIELMQKPESVLQDRAAMVEAAEFRPPAKNETNKKVLPFPVTASGYENREDDNLEHEAVTASTPSKGNLSINTMKSAISSLRKPSHGR